MIRILAARKARGEADAVLAFVRDADPAVQSAAVQAMGEIGDERHLAPVLDVLRTAPDGALQQGASAAAAGIARRISSESRRVAPFLLALEASDARQQILLLGVLSKVGGRTGCDSVAALARKSGDAGVREAALRALTDWQDAAAMAPLFEMAGTLTEAREKILVIRGLARLAGQPPVPEKERLQACRQLFKMADRPEERRLVLGLLGTVRSREAMSLAGEYLRQADTRAEAALAVAKIASPAKKQRPVAVREDAALL